MGKNICKQSNWQEINLQNIQTAHAAQYQKNNQKMGRRPKETFLQGRHTDGQEAHEKMLWNYFLPNSWDCSQVLKPFTSTVEPGPSSRSTDWNGITFCSDKRPREERADTTVTQRKDKPFPFLWLLTNFANWFRACKISKKGGQERVCSWPSGSVQMALKYHWPWHSSQERPRTGRTIMKGKNSSSPVVL